MNRLEFEELELQVQQSGLPLKSYLQQIGTRVRDKFCSKERELV